MSHRKIKEYVLLDITVDDQDDSIIDFLADGWQPFGSPCCTWDHDMCLTVHFQAMVRYETEAEINKELRDEMFRGAI